MSAEDALDFARRSARLLANGRRLAAAMPYPESMGGFDYGYVIGQLLVIKHDMRPQADGDAMMAAENEARFLLLDYAMRAA